MCDTKVKQWDFPTAWRQDVQGIDGQAARGWPGLQQVCAPAPSFGASVPRLALAGLGPF